MPGSRPVILVGGAGFIGRALGARLAAQGIPVVAVTRTPVTLGPGIAVRAAGDLNAATDWPALLEGAGTAVHLASRAARADRGRRRRELDRGGSGDRRRRSAAPPAGPGSSGSC